MKRTPEMYKKISDAQKGEKGHNWNGGISYSGEYVKVNNPSHPFSDKRGYVRQHRLVMEKHIGRFLSSKELVHHINRKKHDNRIENLLLLPNKAAHTALHNKLRNAKSNHH